MADISDKVWAEYIMMDYAPNLRKDPVQAKKDLTKFLQDTTRCASQIYNLYQ